MRSWKKERDGTIIKDIVKYTKRFVAENCDNDVRIYVGTDSQNLRKRPWSGYISCIAFHVGKLEPDGEFYGKGVHIVYYPFKYKKIIDNFSRLWHEVTLSMETAEELRSNGILINRIDLDFNQDETHDSSRVVMAAEGLFRGLGYDVASKPEKLVASRAADHIIHSIDWKNVELTDFKK